MHGETNCAAMESLVILGSGPAGLTAAIYAARADLQPLVVSGYVAGGQLLYTTEVENFPGFPEGIQGPELMERLRAQAERFGARFEDVDASAIVVSDHPGVQVTLPDRIVEARYAIVATGASARWLGIPGEELLRGRGVSSCATCDGAFFRDKRIVVVGGGDSAMEEALFLTRFASEVTLMHRRDAFRASRIMVHRVEQHPKIRLRMNTVVQAAIGEKKLEAIELRDLRSGTTERFAADGLFVAIGHDPNTAFLRGVVDLDEEGYIRSVDGVHTSQKAIFVAGDVNDRRYRQAVTAAAAGCRAALEVEHALQNTDV